MMANALFDVGATLRRYSEHFEMVDDLYGNTSNRGVATGVLPPAVSILELLFSRPPSGGLLQIRRVAFQTEYLDILLAHKVRSVVN